jgi:hypothetical protein
MRHLLAGAHGLVLVTAARAADIQDQNSGVLLIVPLIGRYPYLLKRDGDGGLSRAKPSTGLALVRRVVNVEVVRRCDNGQ